MRVTHETPPSGAFLNGLPLNGRDDTGAVTVDGIALALAVLMFALAVVSALSGGA